MERKIGEIFEYNSEWYQCVESPKRKNCNHCDMNFAGKCPIPIKECAARGRRDETNIIFKKLEKVGEPFIIAGILYQHYKAFDIDNVCGNGFWCVHNYKSKILTVEIKQNKKDMEEKKQKIDDLVGLYSSGKITYKEFDKELKALYDKEESEPTLKEFDIEAAKQGKPVCTRDGRKARIICFDKDDKNNMPIVALVYKENESVCIYYEDGRQSHFNETKNDLMMLPEKKEGWVNIDKGGSGKITISSPYSTKEEAIHNDNETTIDTIKICWEE